MVLVRELVDGQQLHGRHAQLHQVLDRRRVRQPGVGAPEFLRYAGVQLGEAAHVDLVDHRVRPRCLRAAVVHPLVVGGVVVDDDALRDVGRGVAVVAHGVRDLLLRPVADVRVHLGRQPELAVHRPRVRVEEQLRRVPARAGPRVPAAVHPEAVALSRHDARQEAVPDLVRQLGQRGARLHALRVEQTQLDRLRTPRPQREVGARHLVGTDPEPRPQRHRRPRPHRQGRSRVRGAVQHGCGPWRRYGLHCVLHGHAVVDALLLHGLLLGCARHRPASRGSWNDMVKGSWRPGRVCLSCRSPHCSAQSLGRTHVSPERARSLGTP